MKITKGYRGLVVIVGVAVLFLIFGLFVIGRNFNTPPTPKPTPTVPPAPSPEQTPTPPPDQSTADWLTYVNTKYSYQVMYPLNLKAGSVSGNSVLGTFQNPVKGFHVGPLVFVTLTGSLRQSGADYFNQSYQVALHPPAPIPGGPGGGCSIDKINNSNVTVQSVSCTGEGGAARYALIKGVTYDIFVDGYSKGFDNQANGELAKASDYTTLLSTFQFGTGTTTPPPPAVQSFTVIADDNGATPAEISVPTGTIVDLTFNVTAQNVNYGGLDFRAPTVSTGTIQAGASKTIAFTAQQSFLFTPYSATNNGTRPYTVKVTVTAVPKP